MGTGFYPDLLDAKAICPQHFPEQWQFFLLPLLVSKQTPNNSSGEWQTCPLKLPRCRCQSARHPPQMLHSKHNHNCCLRCTYLHFTTPKGSSPFYIPCCWKAKTCYSRTQMAITLGAHSSNKRVSHLLPQNLCFPCCLHSKFSIWFNDQGELITSPFEQFHCAKNKINYHPSYILTQKFLITLSSWSSFFFSSHALPWLYLLSFQFICSKPTTSLLGMPWYHIMENLEIKLV